MTVTIIGTPKEIAALVDELQERRTGSFASNMGAVTSAKIAGIGLRAEKLGDPAETTHKIAGHAVTTDMLADDPQPISDAEQRSLESRFPVFQDPERYVGAPQKP